MLIARLEKEEGSASAAARPTRLPADVAAAAVGWLLVLPIAVPQLHKCRAETSQGLQDGFRGSASSKGPNCLQNVSLPSFTQYQYLSQLQGAAGQVDLGITRMAGAYVSQPIGRGWMGVHPVRPQTWH